MEIIYRKDIAAIFETKDIPQNDHWIIRYFLYNCDEVLYFVEGDFLKAVVSVGDVFRYLEKKEKKILNTNFTQVSEKDLTNVQTFFLEHPTIHELPLINSAGHFIGIIKSNSKNPEYVRDGFRDYIKRLYFDQFSYYQNLSNKFMEYFKGQVFLFDLPDDNRAFKVLHTSYEREMFSKKRIVSPLVQLQEMNEAEEKDYWGEAYEPGISKKFVKDFLNIKTLERNGCKYCENNGLSHYITFDNGKRVVANKAKEAERKLYLVGPCTIFGAYVTDEQTMGYYLQKLLSQNWHSFEVVNFGSLGIDYEFQYLVTECINDNDIVIIASQNKNLISLMKQYENTCYLGDFSNIFEKIHNPLNCILDTFKHVNYRAEKEFAKRIYEVINVHLLSEKKEYKRKDKKPLQNYFISWDIVMYYKEFAMQHGLNNLTGVIGAIVMNCNPFTKGHRYLIEYAAEKVDTLIIFVVEEDASAFSFHDRMKMVKMGTSDIDNVKVIPSGKYNISKSTFAQYFEKEKNIDKIDSMDYDLRIFCEVIADCMHISCRFVGEEPTDMVTRQYNETMKKILPKYDIEFIEIPRLKINEREYVSASKVRQYLKNRDWKSVLDFLPETTIEYLKNKEGEAVKRNR